MYRYDIDFDDPNYHLTSCCLKEIEKCRCSQYGEEWLKDHYPLAKFKGKDKSYKPLFMTLECELIWVYERYTGAYPKLFRVWENGKLLSNFGFYHNEFEILGQWFQNKQFLLSEPFSEDYVSIFTQPESCPKHFLFKIDWTMMFTPGYKLSKGDCVLDYNKPTSEKLAQEKENQSWSFGENKGTDLPITVLDISLDELRAKGTMHFPHLSYEHYPNPLTLPFAEQRHAKFLAEQKIQDEKDRIEYLKEQARLEKIYEEYERYR